MVEVVRKNWHLVVVEQRRWRGLLYIEWSRHKRVYASEGGYIHTLEGGRLHS